MNDKIVSFVFEVQSVLLFISTTLMCCLHRGSVQRGEEESGELLHHANLQVNGGSGQLLKEKAFAVVQTLNQNYKRVCLYAALYSITVKFILKLSSN